MAPRREMIAVCQMTSDHSMDKSFETMKDMIQRAADRKCKMVFFPECCDFIGRTREESIDMAMYDTSSFIAALRQEALKNNIWLSLGGIHEKVDYSKENLPNVDSKVGCKPKNCHMIIDESGSIVEKYRKLHLFDLEIPGKVRLMESEFSSAGHKLIPPVGTPVGRLGLGICYDVRFPELSLWYRRQGAEILSYPAAFTVNTGLAHWEPLLRARAIETQSYVVAAAQTGKHNDKRSSYGHSMVVDPWGAVIAQCSENVDMCFAEINLDYLNEVRTMQPVFQHRRNDLYSFHANSATTPSGELNFGGHKISKDTVFYQTGLSYAFVNLKPAVEGHVLISPLRDVLRLNELTDEETADLFIVAKRVQSVIEKVYGTTSSTIAVQDGPLAGQSVKHVHVHIVPRKPGDFKEDQIYKELEKHDRDGRPPRTPSEMATEAEKYRKLM
ncbi:hypothetical protein L596_005031 [Steinernema carpocapsae]|nr:hypothetical protein L596_005031 [Steinernema carpocapsae]